MLTRISMVRKEDKNEALAFIESGGRCVKRFGWGWKGGRTEPCSKEEALRLLKTFHFGMGFYMLDWADSGNTLEFCELSGSDML